MLSAGDLTALCLCTTSHATSNELLLLSIQTPSHDFFQQKKTHIKSHNKAESISPEETQSFSLFVLMMLKRKKRALRLPKGVLVKDPRIKAQFHQNTTLRCGGFDCVCTARTVVACTLTVQPQVIQKSLQ